MKKVFINGHYEFLECQFDFLRLVKDYMGEESYKYLEELLQDKTDDINNLHEEIKELQEEINNLIEDVT